jgi:hypothetical protein
MKMGIMAKHAKLANTVMSREVHVKRNPKASEGTQVKAK